MLSIEFMVGSFGSSLVLGYVIGKQFLIFKQAIEVSTSN
ncbi:hypothetical protein VII00023_20737 [Vibrio ichthyoenteri ATCC 700023]|uniref:Uncharacterized protein n=1 Tax=Vibrio ichthyoenteri ATCC 700023 TaxID=870968 RepID=F9S7W0_9VIBR|nr:hypothetical protein VII00023_20737 [Vibrio ichthyoenteri ATCC 700023]